MSLQSGDVNDYSIEQLMSLFSLSPGFTEESLQLSRQKLVAELPTLRNPSITRPHEVALFIDCACNRLRDEGATHPGGTWAQKTNPLLKGAGSHAVQSNANSLAGQNASITTGRRAETGDVPPGWLNPINVRTLDFAINIDSRFRENYYSTSSTDWKMDLPVVQSKVSSMRVASLEFPLSYYAISQSTGNATMLVVSTATSSLPGTGWNLSDPSRPIAQTFPVGGKQAWLVTLADGNYENQGDATDAGVVHIVPFMNAAIAASIIGSYDELSGRFVAKDKIQSAPAPVPDICFAVDQASCKARFTCDADSKDSYSVYFAVDRGGNRDLGVNLQLKLGWQLGFRVGSYGPIPSGDCALSEAICSPCGPRYAYLAIDDGNNNHGSNLIASFAASSFSKNIILRINLASEVSSTGAYKHAGKAGLASAWWRSREYFGPVTISKLGFKLFDEYGRIIDLNGMDWSMALVFESIYD